jgi:hypothetical protein
VLPEIDTCARHHTQFLSHTSTVSTTFIGNHILLRPLLTPAMSRRTAFTRHTPLSPTPRQRQSHWCRTFVLRRRSIPGGTSSVSVSRAKRNCGQWSIWGECVRYDAESTSLFRGNMMRMAGAACRTGGHSTRTSRLRFQTRTTTWQSFQRRVANASRRVRRRYDDDDDDDDDGDGWRR